MALKIRIEHCGAHSLLGCFVETLGFPEPEALKKHKIDVDFYVTPLPGLDLAEEIMTFFHFMGENSKVRVFCVPLEHVIEV